MKKIKVLLIDDDELFLFLTEKSLKNVSCLEKFSSRSSVNEAREYLDSCEANDTPFPDVIFVDMNMPGMNGMDFADFYENKYAHQHPGTKLVILTSSISRKEKVKAMDKPAVRDFLQKPLTEEMLHNLVPVDC